MKLVICSATAALLLLLPMLFELALPHLEVNPCRLSFFADKRQNEFSPSRSQLLQDDSATLLSAPPALHVILMRRASGDDSGAQTFRAEEGGGVACDEDCKGSRAGEGSPLLDLSSLMLVRSTDSSWPTPDWEKGGEEERAGEKRVGKQGQRKSTCDQERQRRSYREMSMLGGKAERFWRR
eukprot:762900-Hanusia_phi.AAC.2